MTRLLRGTSTGTDPDATEGAETGSVAEGTDGTGRKPTAEAPDGAPSGAGTESGAGAGPGSEAGTEAGAGPGSDEEGDAGPSRRRALRWPGVALAGAVVALLVGGGWFFHAAGQLRSTPSARNLALTDAGATARVGGDVGEGLARVFSYTPARTDAAERSADHVLAGRAARQYDDLFAQIRASLVAQRITLSTQAVRTGVIELDGDSARLLVFLDQTSRRDKGAATSAAAQLAVTARFGGDRWQIVDIKAR